jgi:hypothetical protein
MVVKCPPGSYDPNYPYERANDVGELPPDYSARQTICSDTWGWNEAYEQYCIANGIIHSSIDPPPPFEDPPEYFDMYLDGLRDMLKTRAIYVDVLSVALEGSKVVTLTELMYLFGGPSLTGESVEDWSKRDAKSIVEAEKQQKQKRDIYWAKIRKEMANMEKLQQQLADLEAVQDEISRHEWVSGTKTSLALTRPLARDWVPKASWKPDNWRHLDPSQLCEGSPAIEPFARVLGLID